MTRRISKEQIDAPDFVTVGRVLGVWGKGGEVKIELLTDLLDQFDPEREVLLNGYFQTIERSHPHKDTVVVKFKAINDIRAADRLQACRVEIPIGEIPPLPEGEFYHFQLIGLAVVSVEGEPVGTITSILPTGSNDVYRLDSPRGEVLIPAIEDVIKSIDLENGQVTIEVIDGLL